MQLAIFEYQDSDAINELTTLEIDGEVWFVAADICKLLDIKNVSDALTGLDEDEKTTSVLPRAGQTRKVNLVNESGLYALIFRSKKETAKKFRKWVTSEVIPSIRKTGKFGIDRIATPNFITRFNANWDRTDKGHFSVISELFIRLHGKFEHVGYRIPDKAITGKEIRPDVSVGRLFSSYLKTYHSHLADEFTYYNHLFPDGYEVEARQYKNELLPVFIEYIENDWIPNCAGRYLGDRDKLALEYLPKILGVGKN